MKTKILLLITILSFLSIQNIFAQERNRQRDNCKQQCLNKLDLTDEQQEKIETMKLDHQMDMIDLKANLEKKKLELKELKNKGNYTREEYINDVEVINVAKDAIAILRANFKMDIYELLDAEQKKEWNELSFKSGERKEKQNKKSKRYKNIN